MVEEGLRGRRRWGGGVKVGEQGGGGFSPKNRTWSGVVERGGEGSICGLASGTVEDFLWGRSWGRGARCGGGAEPLRPSSLRGFVQPHGRGKRGEDLLGETWRTVYGKSGVPEGSLPGSTSQGVGGGRLRAAATRARGVGESRAPEVKAAPSCTSPRIRRSGRGIGTNCDRSCSSGGERGGGSKGRVFCFLT